MAPRTPSTAEQILQTAQNYSSLRVASYLHWIILIESPDETAVANLLLPSTGKASQSSKKIFAEFQMALAVSNTCYHLDKINTSKTWFFNPQITLYIFGTDFNAIHICMGPAWEGRFCNDYLFLACCISNAKWIVVAL